MSFTDAPDPLTQLATQLTACAGWSSGSGAIHYPESPDFTGATFPLAVLADESRSVGRYAVGAAGLVSGTLVIRIYGTGTIGVTEALGRTILSQLLAQEGGIVFRSSECGLSADPEPGRIAGDAQEIRSITLSLPYGLEF